MSGPVERTSNPQGGAHLPSTLSAFASQFPGPNFRLSPESRRLLRSRCSIVRFGLTMGLSVVSENPMNRMFVQLRERLSAALPGSLAGRPGGSYGRDIKPPGPPAAWGVRNYLAMRRDGLDFFTRLQRVHGDVVHAPLFGLDCYFLFHPDHIEQVLRRHAANVIKDVPTRDGLSRALGQGLVTTDGPLWRQHRKLVSFAFTPRRIASYGATMAAAATRTLSRWRVGETIDIHAEMSRMTMDVVAQVLFGADVERDADTVGRAMSVINDGFANSPEILLNLPGWLPTPNLRRFRDAVRSIDDVLYRIIAEHRASPRGNDRGSGDDLLGALLSARDESEGAEGTASVGFTDQQLRDHCVTLFLAGHETTSLALVHALYFLSQNPDVEARFHKELADVLGDAPATAEAVRELPYTERIIKEAMRLWPPVWGVGREAQKPIEVAGYRFPSGAQLIMCQWVVHRDRRWYADPERFDPDRFAPDAIAARPRLAYFPFGAGPRVCIGNHFAMLEAVLLLALIGQRVQLRMEPGQNNLEFLPSVTIQPKHGGWRMRVHPRTV